MDLSLTLGSLDHAACIAKAFREVWPTISLITCWPHLVRNAKKKIGKLSKPEFFSSTIHPHLDLLHYSRSQGQFAALAKLCIAEWRAKGENEYADWFSTVYLAPPWDSWHAASSGSIAGVLPSQNPLEAFHCVIKKVCGNSIRTTTARVLHHTLPCVLSAKSTEKTQTFVGHYCEGPVPAPLVDRAVALKNKESNYMLLTTPGSENVTAVVFNAHEYANSVANPHKGLVVTKQRMTRRYTQSLSGKLVANKPVADAQLLYQSLHRVLVLASDCPPFECVPVWKTAQSGWICEHVLATMAITNVMAIDSQITSLPFRKSPGGQFKSRGPLSRVHKNSGDAQFFDINRLKNMFLELPGSPMHWRP